MSDSSGGDLPRRLRLYLAALIVGGPVVAVAAAAVGPHRVSWAQAALAVLLAALAATADRFRFHLTYRTHFDVTTAVWMAAVLTLPSSVPGLLALLAVLAGEALRHPLRDLDLPEALFNAGQTAISVAVAAAAYAAATEPIADLPARVDDVGLVLAVVAAGTVLHLVNTGLVAGAAGLHQGIDPFRLWIQGLGQDLVAHALLVAIGAAALLVTSSHPLALIAFALPVVLVERAVRQTVRLRHDTHAALAGLVEVVELRDPDTAGHSRRVAASARALALRLGLTHEEADRIESAGRVHDLGKVAIDPDVLTKAGKLEAAEWAEMQRHPGLGADVIARFAAYPGGDRLVRHHHERWDGAGYPDGLAGEAIPFGARILAVADAFDALTSDRPYRRGMGLDGALGVLQDGAGTQWDPQIVAAMVELVREGVVQKEPKPAAASPAPIALGRPSPASAKPCR